MKKQFSIFFIYLFISACGNKELKKEEAVKIISQFYQLPHQKEIAIDKIYDDLGEWRQQVYGQLANKGLVTINQISNPYMYNQLGVHNYFQIETTESGRKYWTHNGSISESIGDIGLIIFKGYLIDIKDVNISSNAKENKAEAEVILKTFDISPIQEIFSPLKETEIKQTIHFKLFDNGWKIDEDVNSKMFYDRIEIPFHPITNSPIMIDQPGNGKLMKMKF